MEYKEYKEKYGFCYGHNNISDGEIMYKTLEELLENLKDSGYPCPDTVEGGIPVKVEIDEISAVESIEERMYDHDFAGEEYYMSEAGKEFLMKCFKEYNERYATYGNYCDTVTVVVPEEMKYKEVEEY